MPILLELKTITETFARLGLTIPITLSPRQTIAVEDNITLEMIRNVEMASRGKFYIDEIGKAHYDSRFARVR